jgi:hypothetical protein
MGAALIPYLGLSSLKVIWRIDPCGVGLRPSRLDPATAGGGQVDLG